MTRIESLEDKIKRLEREQKYLADDIEDLREKIEEEKQTEELYMEE